MFSCEACWLLVFRGICWQKIPLDVRTATLSSVSRCIGRLPSYLLLLKEGSKAELFCPATLMRAHTSGLLLLVPNAGENNRFYRIFWGSLAQLKLIFEPKSPDCRNNLSPLQKIGQPLLGYKCYSKLQVITAFTFHFYTIDICSGPKIWFKVALVQTCFSQIYCVMFDIQSFRSQLSYNPKKKTFCPSSLNKASLWPEDLHLHHYVTCVYIPLYFFKC